MSINRGMDKEMWYRYTMEYYSPIKKNKIMPFAATWMKLKMIILSEFNQTKTNTILHHLHVQSKLWPLQLFLIISVTLGFTVAFPCPQLSHP